MEKFSDWEKQGLSDLLKSELFQESTFSIAKIVSKNMLTPQTVSGSMSNHFFVAFFFKK